MSERHHRKSAERRRQYEQFDKTLYRLPAPFYRLPDRTIKARPTAAVEVAFIVQRRIYMGRGSPTLSVGLPEFVLGWRVVRAHDVAIGYYVRMDDGFATLERHGRLPDEDEGITWCRTWTNDEAHRALLAAESLR